MKRMSTTLALALALVGGVAWAGANDDLVKATKLPVQADALRKAGVPDAEVAEAVRTAEKHGLSAGEAEEVLEEGAEAEKDHGRIDNFGKFVNDRLDEGLRGRDLAAAIRAEHEKRGKGPKGKGKGKGHDKHGEDHPGKGKGHDKHGDGAEDGHPGKGKGHDKHGEDHPGKGKGHDKHGDGAEDGQPGKGKHGAGKGGSGKGHGEAKKDKAQKGKGKSK